MEPKRLPPNPPITRHPLFPAIVALWFAALLGMGSFALSLPALEQLVLSAHIDALIPAAAPPLGMTARLAMVMTLGGVGGTIGWFLALRIARPAPRAEPSVFKVADVGFDRPIAAPTAPEIDGPALDPAPPLTPVIEAAPPPHPITAAERIASADLAHLSHVELIERLAIAIRKREALRAAQPVERAAMGDSIVRFPDVADRQVTRLAPAPRPAPYETEKALRDALAALKQMSGG